MLNDILGKYPLSSSSANSGKNIAIGGNITDITHAKVLYTPSISAFMIIGGILRSLRMNFMYFSTPNKNLDSNSDGKFAPFIVIKNIKLNKSIITNISNLLTYFI